MSETAVITYNGSTPGADSSTYVLFSSVVAFPGKRMHSGLGLKRFVCGVRHSSAGTINLYKSTDRGTNWVLCDTFSAASTTLEDLYDALVEHFDDFKVEWVNSGSAQSPWTVSLALSSGRAASV
jgi:hypothetical protein